MKRILIAAVCMVLLASSTATARTFISVGTNPVGMALYTMGAGIADVVGREIPEIDFTVEATKGGIHNLYLMGLGDLEFAFTAPGAALQAYKGEGIYQKAVPVLGMFSHQIAYQQLPALKDSNIVKIGDIENKRIGVGPPGSLARADNFKYLTASGFERSDFEAFSETLPEMSEKMKNGQLDAAMWFGAIPLAPLMDLAQTRELNWVPANEAKLKRLLEENPMYFITDLPANTYPGQTQAVRSLAYRHNFVARADVPEELVYKMMKTIFGNLDDLGKVHRGWRVTSFDTALQSMSIPLHPGAIRYFREAGHPDIEEFVLSMNKKFSK